MALGVHLGGQGVPLDAFGAQAVPRTALLSYGRSILSDFGTQREPKQAPKMELKSIKNDSKIYRNVGLIFKRFLEHVWSIFGVFLGPWTFNNECLVWARCYFSEIRVFHT